MTHPNPGRSEADLPTLPAPRPLRDRRVRLRREADRAADSERRFTIRCLDIAAADLTPDARLVRLLALVAGTAGASEVAVLSDVGERRVAVHAGPGKRASAEALAAWLDARAPRSRADRAAAPPASVLVVEHPDGRDEPSAGEPNGAAAAADTDLRASRPVDDFPGVVLGFAFRTPAALRDLDRRFPPPFARHAVAALAVLVREVAVHREMERLVAADAERGRFVSTVAHELRTPLTGLSGYLELILAGQVEDPAVEREFLERGRDIVETMSGLVGDLLELSRLESGTLRLAREPFSVAEAVASVVSAVQPIASRRAVRLTTSLPPRLRTAIGDRRRVEQVVMNLVANALKFAPAGGDVEVVARFDAGAAVVAVRDEGPGIPADDRRQVFERFFRLGGHERIAGTGLGLPIARELAQAMGGDLALASVEGTGSAFVLVLPGPATDDRAAVDDVLRRAVALEEIRLEGVSGRPALAEPDGPPPRPRLVSSAQTERTTTRPVPDRGTHLRSLDAVGRPRRRVAPA